LGREELVELCLVPRSERVRYCRRLGEIWLVWSAETVVGYRVSGRRFNALCGSRMFAKLGTLRSEGRTERVRCGAVLMLTCRWLVAPKG
jgi:hypothetical protein